MEKQSFELVNGMKQHSQVHQLIYKGAGSRILFFFRLYKQIKLICANNPEITLIHFNDALVASFCLLLKLKRSIKFAVTLHGLDVVYPSYLYKKLIFPKLNRYDLFLAVSKSTAQAAIAQGIDASKVKVIPNGVDTGIARFRFSSNFYDDFYRKYHLDIREYRLLVAMGRPVKRKGFSWFLENVYPKLNNNYFILFIGPFHQEKTKMDFFLRLLPKPLRIKVELFLGYPSDESKLRKLLSQPEIRKRCKHLGRLPMDEAFNVLHHAHAFIMPNIEVSGDMEGFGLVCLEATLCGTPVYAAASGGISDAVKPEKNGYLLPPENAAAWSEQLNKSIIESTSKADMERFKAYTIRNFSWKKMVNAYYRAFLSLRN